MIEKPQLPGIRGGAPVHPLSALVTIMLDWLWTTGEFAQTLSVVGIPTLLLTSILLALICLIVVTLVQIVLANDGWGPAVVKGLVLGVFAGVPYPVAGTIVGVPLLAWAGIDGIRTFLLPRRAS